MRKHYTLSGLLLCLMTLLTLGASAQDYLCFTANTAGSTIKLVKQKSPNTVTIEYSTDKSDWKSVDFSVATATETITLENAGDKVYFRNAEAASKVTGFSKSGTNYYMFVMTGSIAASGNVMSLVDKSCESIEILGNYCFNNLFKDCTALTTAPELPATTLTSYCYRYMFSNTSLTMAPVLPATTLANYCYQNMFNGSTALNVVKVGFTSFDGPTYPTSYWFTDVASTGIFICPESLDTSSRGASKVPEGWSVNGYDLTVSSVGWASMYLPIDVTIPEGVKVYYAASASDNVVTLKPITGAIPAGTGVIVKAAEGKVFFPYTTAAVTPVEGNLLEGVASSTACNASENYVLNISTSTAEAPCFSNYTGTSLGAFKAYLPKSAVGGASSIQFRFADATAVSTVETEAAEDVIYNLAGQRVGSDYRGLVIKNGKKMWNK